MRTRTFALAGLTAVAAGVWAALPAQAADQSVVAQSAGTSFSPATVTVNAGETVTFRHSAGLFPHNVKFEDGAFEKPAAPSAEAWTVSRRFGAPGTFRYYCEQHGGPGGQGMSGKVIVVSSGAPSDTIAPSISGLKAVSGPFGKTRPVRLSLRLSEAARLDGRLVRRPLRTGSRLAGSGAFKPFGTTRASGAKGLNRLDVTRTRSGRRLTPGEYRLTLVATDTAKNRSKSRTTRFFVRAK